MKARFGRRDPRKTPRSPKLVRVALHAGTHPLLELRHFWAALVILLLALAWHRRQWVGLALVSKPFILIAPWSYALYLLHEPVGLHSGWMNFVPNPYLRIMANLLVVCTLAWASERYLHKACCQLFRR
jgi:peptidoglycan/LPS O-acetylase OafA/YrhL